MGLDLASNRFLQFLELAVNNPPILDRFNELPDDVMPGLLKIASEAGFWLTPEDVNAVVKEVQFNPLPEDELSEEDLDAVAGGTSKPSPSQQILTNILIKIHEQNMAVI